MSPCVITAVFVARSDEIVEERTKRGASETWHLTLTKLRRRRASKFTANARHIEIGKKDSGATSQTLGSGARLARRVFHKLGAAVEVLFQPYFDNLKKEVGSYGLGY